MRASLYATLAGGLLLSGCSDSASVDAKNESPEGVAAKVAAADLKPRAGRWEGTFKLEKMEIPGMPPEAAAQMQKAMGTAQTHSSCLTEAEAARPNAEFFQKGAAGCTYERFTMAGGRIDAQMTCPAGAGPTTMTMAGTYSEDSYDMRVTGSGELQKGVSMNMAMAISSRRVGECNGTEAK